MILDVIYFTNVIKPSGKRVFFKFFFEKCQNLQRKVILLSPTKAIINIRFMTFQKGYDSKCGLDLRL
jgi:hypothetical protein